MVPGRSVVRLEEKRHSLRFWRAHRERSQKNEEKHLYLYVNKLIIIEKVRKKFLGSRKMFSFYSNKTTFICLIKAIQAILYHRFPKIFHPSQIAGRAFYTIGGA